MNSYWGFVDSWQGKDMTLRNSARHYTLWNKTGVLIYVLIFNLWRFTIDWLGSSVVFSPFHKSMILDKLICHYAVVICIFYSFVMSSSFVIVLVLIVNLWAVTAEYGNGIRLLSQNVFWIVYFILAVVYGIAPSPPYDW